jgi:hypothetical protein
VCSTPIRGMDVCAYSVFVLGNGLASADPRPRSPTECLRLWS